MSDCGGRGRIPQLTVIIGLPTEAQETVKFVCKDHALDRSNRVMSEIAETEARPIPKRFDFRDKDLRGKDLADKDLADRQAFAQVEKWMAMIRELDYERLGAKFRG
jgi:hypothetical protein